MKAAVIYNVDQAPAYSDFENPVPRESEVCVQVAASALTNFTKVRAAGKHFSFKAKPPFVVGIDGIGRLEDGRRVYFLFPRSSCDQ